MINLSSLSFSVLQAETESANFASEQQFVFYQVLFACALPLDNVFELICHCRRALCSMENPVIKHVAIWTLANKCFWDLVVRFGPHFA